MSCGYPDFFLNNIAEIYALENYIVSVVTIILYLIIYYRIKSLSAGITQMTAGGFFANRFIDPIYMYIYVVSDPELRLILTRTSDPESSEK